ncbi:MAG: FoF1 ATP synthase subunit gamma [Motiliproteus sp.]
MSNQRALRSQIQRLGDIGAIMTAMKNLAFMETCKLERHLQAQSRMVEQIKQSAQICISHFPEALPNGNHQDQPGQQLWLLIGSERGFCGDFNQRLAQQTEAQLQQIEPQGVVTLGYRLNQRAMSGVETVAQLAGANAIEETENILILLTQTLSELQQQRGPFQLRVLFNHPDSSQISSQALLPPFQDLNQTAPQGIAPLINMAPETLLLGLGEHYLFVRLQHILYLSLMAENQLRIAHLQGAIKKLEKRSVDLQRKMNRLRQESIVEEIEIILINQSTLNSPTTADKPH